MGNLYEFNAETDETSGQALLPIKGTVELVMTDDTMLVVSQDARAFRRDVGGLLT